MDFLKGAMERIKPDVERLIRRELGKMAETNAKIHVLADETLGGIKREYVEVDRKAEVGEKIVIVEKDDLEEGYENGDVFTVDRHRPGKSHVESDEAKSDANGDGLIFRREYHVLAPTDIVHIDGGRYELTDRKAKVGEKVVHVDKDCGESDGVVTEVTSVGVSMIDVSVYEDSDGDSVCGFPHGCYRVLVPVEDEPKPADPIDVIANLAQEVASLKRTVDRHRDEIDTLYKDKRTLGEELARLKQDGNTQQPTGTSFADFCEGYIAYSKAMKGARQ
ncbi:hypothetical protein [Bacillus sp. PM43]|uniref:hypothetical protein n=1 Tax=Bacillus sp. PM43 TaxID=3414494 RepID=UPI003DA8D8E2